MPQRKISEDTAIDTIADGDLIPIVDVSEPTAADQNKKSLASKLWEYNLAKLDAIGRREVLLANRTYYVRADGSDSNTGLVDSAGGAFLTGQKAIDTVAALDLSIYDVVIDIANATWTAPIVLKTLVGAGSVTLRGDTTTPANCIISTTSASCITGAAVRGNWKIEGFKLQTTTSGQCISLSDGTRLTATGLMEYGACASIHISLSNGSVFTATANYTISGNATNHWSAVNSIIDVSSVTITLSGTPAFSQFLNAQRVSYLRVFGITFSGSATGSRFNVITNSVVFTNNAGLTYFPGNSAGTIDSGGRYDSFDAIPGEAGSVIELKVRKTGIANNSATAVITVTVPNSTHNAAIFLEILAHLGIGTDASESSRCARGCVVLARTPDVDTVATVSTLESTQIATVSGGGTLTLAYSVSSISGASNATQTFTIRLTLVVTGTITNHIAVVFARLLNSAQDGVTMAAA